MRAMRQPITALALLALAMSACSSGDDPAVDPAGSVGEGSASLPDLPPEDASDGSTFDFTPTITITPDGFLPVQAVAVFGEELTFVNETATAQTIHFTNGSPVIGGAETVGPIPPGESMTFPGELEAAVSLVYEADGLPGVVGRLQIDPGVGTL